MTAYFKMDGNMTTNELIEAAKKTIITKEMVEEMEKRIAKREAIWEDEAHANNSREFLERYYSI